MAKTKDQKKVLVSELSSIAGKAESVVFVAFNGLLVKDETALRASLRDKGVDYKVVKKSLLERALNEKGFSGTMPVIEGMAAIAYGVDKIAPAREVFAFQQEHKDNISIVGGVFEGRYMNQVEMMEIATIPPAEVLYGQFLNVINSPIQRFAAVLDQYASKMETGA